MLKKRNPARSKRKFQKGFTLVEVLLTIAILSIGILGVMTMQIRAARSNSVAGKITESVSWLTDEFERLLSLPYDDANLAPNATVTPELSMVNNPDILAVTDPGPYTVTYTVSNLNVPIPNVKAIDVTVTHDTDPDRTLSFRYYKADTF